MRIRGKLEDHLHKIRCLHEESNGFAADLETQRIFVARECVHSADGRWISFPTVLIKNNPTMNICSYFCCAHTYAFCTRDNSKVVDQVFNVQKITTKQFLKVAEPVSRPVIGEQGFHYILCANVLTALHPACGNGKVYCSGRCVELCCEGYVSSTSLCMW